MSIKGVIENQLIKFGKNNSPTVVVIGVAAVKGIARPLFTMSDKKEKYETRRYTALREGLTEVIAVPVYFFSGVISGQIAKKLAVPKYFMPSKLYDDYKAGKKSADITRAWKQAEILAKENLPKIKTTAAFVGACLSALYIIPQVCSLVIKPIIERIDGNSKKTQKPVSSDIEVLKVPKVKSTSDIGIA